jgi:hypothetical protein
LVNVSVKIGEERIWRYSAKIILKIDVIILSLAPRTIQLLFFLLACQRGQKYSKTIFKQTVFKWSFC